MSEIENKIIECASQLISLEGLSSFSFTKLAKMCCCSKSTLYSNFDSKEDLIIGIYIKKVDEIVAFNKCIIANPQFSAAEKLIMGCMYDVVRVAMDYKSSDRVSLIAATAQIYQFASKHLLCRLKESLLALNETFNQIEQELVSNCNLKEDRIHQALKTYRLQARGIVSCVSNKIYVENCISSTIEELYDGFVSIIAPEIIENTSISFLDCFEIINKNLKNRCNTDI
ncbi:TetR/AcrR family transcriptional regulator [Shewanella avicenniae]|uniref:TetR/AcrR family transcriptional regulator n=1 Tax=Shewanella avicenniae TaxID=2814294 RepID=A0ABX7QM87_9GAMM|nr:TetR/AcrR family transcriptional regulator [Shewanella avicenniae]QSX32568.1 TetR/AcrR family transcriptional regulator [Shewanella avicenniae]